MRIFGRFFLFIAMKTDYTKEPKNFSEQVELLENRGLIIANKTKLENVLKSISYNRLSNYWHPFLVDIDSEKFKPDTHFETIFKIYQFDSELRLLMFYAIEQIEIAVRTQIIFHLSIKYNSGFWFENPSVFKSYTFFADLLNKLCVNVDNSKQEYIKKYKERYNQYIPPSWKSFETLTFNTLFSIFKNLKDKDEQILIGKHFGLHHEVLQSWIETMIYIRNICAHHSRLWNIKLTIKPTWPKAPHNIWVSKWENLNQDTNDKSLRMYASICMAVYLLDAVNPYNKFRSKLSELFNGYSEINLRLMGFPDDWQDEPLWKKDKK